MSSLRLLGLETEYAIRFSPAPGSARPTNEQIYEHYASAVQALVPARRGLRDQEYFLANGGVLHYEAPPYASADGLVEAGTPECTSPSDAILYQRAQDALLVRATPIVRERLAASGFRGDVALLKNCRDAEGHIYGAQENYEADIARGAALVAWRVGLALLVPFVLLSTLAVWTFVVVLIPPAIVALIAHAIGKRAIGEVRMARVARFMERALWWIERVMWEPSTRLFFLLYRAFAFRRIRRAITPFLLSRQVFTGAGTLVGEKFALSEKAVATRALCRSSISNEHCVFDAGNLCKRLIGFLVFKPRTYFELFRQRQRMQLGLSDSNMAQTAEYLKIATTYLVVEMAEAGALDSIPRVRLRELHAIAFGDHAQAVAIQREYVARARAFVREAPSLETHDVVTRWGALLDALERDPSSLVGSIDWITKRTLIDNAAPAAEQKKIDLKYHELATGYFAAFELRGLAPILVTAEEARAAAEQPPAGPARARARLMNALADKKIRVGWTKIRVGGPLRGRDIPID